MRTYPPDEAARDLAVSSRSTFSALVAFGIGLFPVEKAWVWLFFQPTFPLRTIVDIMDKAILYL
jgi:hypothetical protein